MSRKLFGWLLVFVVLTTASLFSVKPPMAEAIIGGVRDATTNDVVVALHQVGYLPSCSGTLIAPTWVVTAAHCVWDDTLGAVTPYFSQLRISTSAGFSGLNTASSLIRGIAVHPSYSNWRNGYDIALIKVDDVFGGKFSPLASAEEIRTFSDSFSLVTASGFGLTSENGSPSRIALEVALTLLSHDTCLNYLPSELQLLSQTILCANGSSTAATCSGDSGGPLFLNTSTGRKLAGATSFGSTLCTASRTRYTNVSSYLAFLNSYGVALPVSAIVPAPASILVAALPNPQVLPPSSPIFQTPVLPTFNAVNPVVVPKFSTSRTFQLLLDKVSSKQCEIDIDGPIEFTNLKIQIFIGKNSTKQYLSKALNSFGDTRFKARLTCESVRKQGVFVRVESSAVRLRVIE